MVFVFGGGGSPSPIGETLAIFAACVCLAVFAWRGYGAGLSAGDWALAAILPALAVIQLVPLPPAIWSDLPSRAAVQAAYAAAGAGQSWQPLSIDPMATLWSLLCLSVPVAAFLLARTLDPPRSRQVLAWVIAVGIASSILGGLQQLGGEVFFLHPRSIDAGASGLFANQNTQATFLACALAALVAWLADRKELGAGERMIAVLVGLLLGAGLLLTRSRSGLVLLAAVGGTGALLPALRYAGGRLTGWRRVALAVAGFIGAAAVLAIALQLTAVQTILARFAATSDDRMAVIWPDALYLARSVWPAGSGLGTFVPAFTMVEQLALVDPLIANRAHNDWLEFIIEAGALALVALITLIVFLFNSLRRKVAHGMAPRDWWSCAVLAIIALHSFVDYPLRALPMALVGAMAIGLIRAPLNKKA